MTNSGTTKSTAPDPRSNNIKSLYRTQVPQLSKISQGGSQHHESRRKQTVLFPVRIDDTVLKTGEAWALTLRDQRDIGDFRKWKDHDAYQQAFNRVLRDLKTVPG